MGRFSGKLLSETGALRPVSLSTGSRIPLFEAVMADLEGQEHQNLRRGQDQEDLPDVVLQQHQVDEYGEPVDRAQQVRSLICFIQIPSHYR